AVEPDRPECVRRGEALDRVDRYAAAAAQLLDRPVWPPGNDAVRCLAMEPVDLSQPETQRRPPLPFKGGEVFKRAIPVAEIHIHRAHLDPVLARVADDLRGGVEAHRLAVQQRAGKSRGIFPPEP